MDRITKQGDMALSPCKCWRPVIYVSSKNCLFFCGMYQINYVITPTLEYLKQSFLFSCHVERIQELDMIKIGNHEKNKDIFLLFFSSNFYMSSATITVFNQSWTIKLLSVPLLVQLRVWSPKNLQYLKIIPNNFRYFREYSLLYVPKNTLQLFLIILFIVSSITSVNLQ